MFCFPTPPLFDAPSGGTPYDINICTLLKSTFNGLQFHRSQYGSIFVYPPLAPKSPKACQIPREFDVVAGQGHPSILVLIKSAYATFY